MKRVQHGQRGTRLYNIWSLMKKRCYSANRREYPNYGGRGITVCDEWRDGFLPFFGWALSHGYRDDLTLDRRDGDGPYAPWNCRWTDWQTQMDNRRVFKNNTSGYPGVVWHKQSGKWQSRVCVNGKYVHLGYFKNINDAVAARDAAVRLKKSGKEVLPGAMRAYPKPAAMPRPTRAGAESRAAASI